MYITRVHVSAAHTVQVKKCILQVCMSVLHTECEVKVLHGLLPHVAFLETLYIFFCIVHIISYAETAGLFLRM